MVEKKTIMTMAPAREPELAKMKIRTPSITKSKHCQRRRPLIPILEFALSDTKPPMPRAKRFCVEIGKEFVSDHLIETTRL
jgi:hypothetical protein